MNNDEKMVIDSILDEFGDLNFVYNDCTRLDRLKNMLLSLAATGHRKARWEWMSYENEVGEWYCSRCRFIPAAFHLNKTHLNYCPSCGSYMKEGE